MPYEMAWDTPGKVLRLKMFDAMTLEIFIEIDWQINERLQECNERIVLIVDASSAKVAPYGIERIKSSQTYLQNHQIERLVVISDNKLNRLAMLLLFNLSRPKLQFCDSFDQAQRYISLMFRTSADA
jgi:hypothetical protein